MIVFDPFEKPKVKLCSCCESEQPLSEFHRNWRRPDKLTTTCKLCHSLKCKQYYKKNREHIVKVYKNYLKTNRKKHKECCKRWYEANRDMISYYSTKSYSKQSGIKFNIDKETFLKRLAPMKCELTGKRLKFNKECAKDDSTYITRVNRKRGYTKKNLVIYQNKVGRDIMADIRTEENDGL